MHHFRVLLTGTDPESGKGGIANVLPSYMSVLKHFYPHVELIPTHHASAKHGKWLWLLKALPALWKQIRTQKRKGIKILVYGHAGAGPSLFRQSIVMALCRMLGAVAILHLHAHEVDTYLDNPVKKALFKLSILPAHAVAVLTPWWYGRLRECGITKKLFVVPNPLPSSWEDLARLPSNNTDSAGQTIILALTRLEPGKGVDLVIEAMPHLAEDIFLIVAGNGSCMNTYRNRVTDLGLDDRVQFRGWVSGEEKQKLFEQSNIFCHPTSYDSFGMGILEAMANGLPVVALDWGPISDIVSNGKVGILIGKEDPKMLAKGIEKLLDQDLRKDMGIEAKKLVLEKFSGPNVGRLIYLMFEETFTSDQ